VGFYCFSTMCKFFIIGIRVQFENSGSADFPGWQAFF